MEATSTVTGGDDVDVGIESETRAIAVFKTCDDIRTPRISHLQSRQKAYRTQFNSEEIRSFGLLSWRVFSRNGNEAFKA